jgi:hypothetical protein
MNQKLGMAVERAVCAEMKKVYLKGVVACALFMYGTVTKR